MNKKDWKNKEKLLINNLTRAKQNKTIAEDQIEETEFYLKSIRTQIRTFK